MSSLSSRSVSLRYFFVLKSTNSPCGHGNSTLRERTKLITARSLSWYSTTPRPRREKDRLNISSIIKAAKQQDGGWRSDGRTLSWLHERGFTLDHVERWQEALVSPTAELALVLVTAQSPVYLILQTLRKSTQSRRTFYELLLLYRASTIYMDNSSQFYAICVLMKRALQINNNLLHLLSDDIQGLPLFYSSYHFNHLLKILSTSNNPSAQVFATQVIVVEQMQSRGVHFNSAGYKALLQGYAHDPAKLADVERQMSQAGYSLIENNLSTVNSSRLDSVDYLRNGKLDDLCMRLRNAKSFSQLSSCIAIYQDDLSNISIWRSILSLYQPTHEAISLCLSLIRKEKLPMTTYLAGLLLQACKSQRSLSLVNDICQTAASRSVTFDTFLWVEYLKRIIWSGQPGEAISIVAIEPGGNHLLDMAPNVRRDSRVWSATIHGINQQVKQGHLTGQKHARYLGMLIRGLREFNIAYTQSLVWCILEAAIYSGPRLWANRHTCDTIVAIFEHEVDMSGTEPWKLPSNNLLWHAYMKVLLANEETKRLSDAMRKLLGTGLTPSPRLMRTFALGIWESGNIQLLEYWRKYFEEETEFAWPDSDAVFATRRALRLQHFYE